MIVLYFVIMINWHSHFPTLISTELILKLVRDGIGLPGK